MENNSLVHTCNLPLTLLCNTSLLTAGFCLSKPNLSYLKSACGLFLHPEEQAYFLKLLHPKRQQSYLLGRFCAKQALAIYTNNSPASIKIENGIFQQPVVCSAPYNNAQVSISHTDVLGAAIAFPETHPMAIDIETICPTKRETILTQLTLSEIRLLSSDTVDNLTMLWTAKEALSKVLRCGLGISFELLEINSIIHYTNWTLCNFKHVYPYQALSFRCGGSVCSLVYPKQTQVKFDINAVQAFIGKNTTA